MWWVLAHKAVGRVWGHVSPEILGVHAQRCILESSEAV